MAARTRQNIDLVDPLEQRGPIQVARADGQQGVWGERGTEQHRRHVEVIQQGWRTIPWPRQDTGPGVRRLRRWPQRGAGALRASSHVSPSGDGNL